MLGALLFWGLLYLLAFCVIRYKRERLAIVKRSLRAFLLYGIPLGGILSCWTYLVNGVDGFIGALILYSLLFFWGILMYEGCKDEKSSTN